MTPFHAETKIDNIVKDNFFLKINEFELYSVLKFEDDEVLDADEFDSEEVKLELILQKLEISPTKKKILTKFVSKIFKEIDKIKGKF